MTSRTGPQDLSQKRRIIILGSFPPPIDGQTVATQRLAGLLKSKFDPILVNMPKATGELVKSKVLFRTDAVRHYLSLAASVRRQLADHNGAPILWSGISPTLPGHLRDILTVQPYLPSRSPLIPIVHWGDFERVFASHATRHTSLRLVRRVTRYVFLTTSLSASCARWIPKEKRAVIPNTIDAELVCSDEEIRTKHQERKARTGLRLLFLSNMIASKGYYDVLRAIPEITGRGITCMVDFVGRWDNERDESNFRSYVAQNQLEPYVRFHGGISDRQTIRKMLLEADAFLLPTYYPTEAQPITIIEAMNAGTPVISTSHAGIPEMMQHGVEGYLVPFRSPSGIAKAVSDLSRFDRWSELSHGARRRFIDDFSPEKVEQLWKQLLRGVAQGNSGTI